MNSLRPVIGELENLFSIINQKYFNNELQKPVITISPDTTKGAYGWCTSWKAWKNGEDEGYYEINMCAEHLNRFFEDIAETMLHEMIHLLNMQNEVKDTSRAGTYHNKSFKESAELHGLVVEKTEKYGWAKTYLSEESKAFFKDLNKKSFNLYREKVMKEKSKAKSSTRKYVCPECGIIIRATKDVSVICSNCSSLFELQGGVK